MLLTTCPNCAAQFKVQPEQLNVRQGRVMCGRCRNVFNAFQSLTRLPESEDASHELVPPATTEETSATPQMTDALFMRKEPAPLSLEFSQTDFDSDIRSSVAADAILSVDVSPSHVATSLADAPMPRAFTGVIAADTEDNPLLTPLPNERVRPGSPGSGWWLSGSVLLTLLLVAQAAFGYRSTITQSFPELRPAFMDLCSWAGCRLSWGRDDRVIGIEASDLIETPGKTGRILLTATVVNRGATRQDLPLLELKLTDNANQLILSRVLKPDEYLGRSPAKDESLAPNVEMYVNLSLSLPNKTQASGYGVRVFYN
jgi:predicted Zn finger-like uncharacterized protein